MEKAAASTFTVLGMHRSGTSALIRSLNILGPRTSDNLLGANIFNATGHWEPKSIVEFNDDVISYFNRHWADAKPFSKDWTESAKFSLYAENAKQLLENEFGHSGSVVFKDPRFSLVLPVWRDAIAARNAEPVYLIALRNPMEVAQSLARRDNLGIEHGLQLWLSYMLEAEIGTRGFLREVVNYEDLLRDWRCALGPVFQYAGVPDLETAGEHRLNAIDALLAPGARHHVVSRSDFFADQKVPKIVKRTYDLFLHFSENQDKNAFDQIRTEWQAMWCKLSPGNDRSTYVDQIPQVQMARSKKLEDGGRLTEALALAKEAAAAINDRAQYQFLLGVLSNKTGDVVGAVSALRRAISLDDKPVRFHLSLAGIFARQGDREQEATILRAAVLRHPNHAELRHRLGVCLAQTDDFAGAVTALRRAISLDDKPVRFHLRLAGILARQGDREQEATILRAAVLRHPNHAALRHRLSVCLERTGDVADAVSALRRAISLDDKPVRFHLSLAGIFARQGDREQEATILRAAVLRHPNHAALRHRLSVCLERTGDLAEGAKSAAETARLDRKVLGYLVNQMPTLQLSAGKGRSAARGRLKPFEKQALVRFLAWQASEYLANKSEKLISSESFDGSNDEPWPMGHSQPIETENPVIPPVGTNTGTVLSVMIPTYEVKSAKWLTHCIEGVLAQDLGPNRTEIVVIDDGPIGGVAQAVVQSFGSRVKYVSNLTRLGLAGNFNRCILASTGKFVHILHQDDWVAPGFYDALLQPMYADDRLVAAFSRTTIVDEENNIKSTTAAFRSEAGVPEGWLETIALGQRLRCPSIIVRRSAYEAVGGFCASLVFALDWDMWARLAALGPVWSDPRPLAYYRQHDSSETFRQDVLDRTIDSMHTVLRNGRLLPKGLRQPIVRTACRHLLVTGNYFQSLVSNKTTPTEKKKNLRLLLRGQTNENYVTLAQALLDI